MTMELTDEMVEAQNRINQYGVDVIRCEACEDICTPTNCDAGIGPYEYWGQRCFDSRPYIGSSCCEADKMYCWFTRSSIFCT